MIATLRKRFEVPAVEAKATAQPVVSIPEDGNILLSGDVAQILREKGVNITSLNQSDEEEEDGVLVEGTEIDLPVKLTGSIRKRRA